MKVRIALFFTFLFLGIIAAPTLISFMDKDQDISVFLALNEEEDTTGSSISEGLKVYAPFNVALFLREIIQKEENLAYNTTNYISQYPIILTQPPETLS
ncbi:hypothetical protein H9I45_10145 [Polaribacter haliotis]|uniref:Uncharacterized protein n=1 Tax=Polaribacter haliotis TaxID=1888915 RepID=A0A7L8ACI1_9FLAO|nr:hypothetical protein [Polaribacter haliotis]QOD59715.1 hypothetical protein H9I45_10145 [Polaribacter haliotis]